MATVGVSLLRALVDEVDRSGHDGRALLVAAGIPSTVLENPEARVTPEQYDRIQRLALRTTGDPALGLHMGESASISSFGMAGHVASLSETLGEALNVLLTYYRLVADTSPNRIVVDGDRIHIVFEIVRSADRLCNRLRQEFALTRMEAIAEAFVRGRRRDEVEMWFEHSRPPYAAEYTRIFRGRERFDRPHAGFVAPRLLLDGLLSARQIHYDGRLFRILKEQAADSLARLDASEGVAAKIRRMIVETSPVGVLGMDAIARRLGISGRSLRRSLQREGQTFSSVASAARRDLACSMLRKRDMTIQEVARGLGFAEASGFHRAFKRWTGLTPAEWRLSNE
jgi:AraC-like DNA-binding protein